MKKVKILALMLAMLLAFGALTGCATQKPAAEAPKTEPVVTTDTDPIVIGCAIQGNQSTFMQYVVSGMFEYQKTNAPDVKLEVVYADDDAAKQASQIETFIAQKVDAIVLNPVDKVQSAAAVDAAFEAGIPVITVNTTSDSKNVAAHVGSDDVEAGKMQMQRIIDVCGPDAKVAYINAVLGHSAQVGREKGYLEILAANPSVTLAAADTGNWSADESMKLVENWIQSGIEIDAILCEADCQLLGVITAVENAGLIGQIKLSGMDCVNEVMQAIEEGKVDSSIWQDGVGQGANAVRLAIDAANGKTVSDFMLPYEVCSGENIATYKEKAVERDALAKLYF